MIKDIKLLDCTLRDGGLGLEDIAKAVPEEKGFSLDSIKKIATFITDSKIDIVELGSIEISDDDKRRFAIYQDIESISKKIPKNNGVNQMFAALYRGPDTPLEDIPFWNESLCEAVRVIIRYSELQKSLDFCKDLSRKGYKVFVQPMLTMRYTEEEIDLLIQASNEMDAYALYFVDSYGYMQFSDIERFFNRYDKGCKSGIRIGFHSHNNMNMAYANVLALLNRESDREIIIDSCVVGMGQGAGNLQTELIVPFLNKHANANYDFESVLKACDEVEKYTSEGKWGYSVTRLIPALYKTAYKYSLELRNQYELTYAEINHILENMPEDMCQRYTVDNTKQLLSRFGYSVK